jgi:ribosomal protein S18 acetylase RimI-like enzyme
MDSHLLDSAVWAALSGPQTNIAEVYGRARRFPFDISPFAAIADQYDEQCWIDLAHLVGAGGTAVLTGRELSVPDSWEVLSSGFGKQMIGENVFGQRDDEAIALSLEDVPEMLDLIARTEPGPFLQRTVEPGGYLGVRIKGDLVAMAGRRMHPLGWIEISAVCTDSAHRGKGLARRIVNAVVAGIRADGEIPFLHVSETNENAIRLYEKMGFLVRMRSGFQVLKAPKQ